MGTPMREVASLDRESQSDNQELRLVPANYLWLSIIP